MCSVVLDISVLSAFFRGSYPSLLRMKGLLRLVYKIASHHFLVRHKSFSFTLLLSCVLSHISCHKFLKKLSENLKLLKIYLLIVGFSRWQNLGFYLVSKNKLLKHTLVVVPVIGRLSASPLVGHAFGSFHSPLATVNYRSRVFGHCRVLLRHLHT
jgi:hypothetical protein